MLVTLVVIAVVALSAFLLYVSRKPDTFRIERSTTIKAAPQAIFPLINDLHSHGLWSPFDTDPATKRTFTGSAAGRGQVYQWDGSRKALGRAGQQVADHHRLGPAVVCHDEPRHDAAVSLSQRGRVHARAGA